MKPKLEDPDRSRGGDDDWVYVFGWTAPLKLKPLPSSSRSVAVRSQWARRRLLLSAFFPSLCRKTLTRPQPPSRSPSVASAATETQTHVTHIRLFHHLSPLTSVVILNQTSSSPLTLVCARLCKHCSCYSIDSCLQSKRKRSLHMFFHTFIMCFSCFKLCRLFVLLFLFILGRTSTSGEGTAGEN